MDKATEDFIACVGIFIIGAIASSFVWGLCVFNQPEKVTISLYKESQTYILTEKESLQLREFETNLIMKRSNND